jgi:hypothetical protein
MAAINDNLREYNSMDVRLAFNAFPMLDILTGIWVEGYNGDDILVGGYSHMNSYVAGPNAGKTALGLHMWATVLNRHKEIAGGIYESEGTLYTKRILDISDSIKEGTPFSMDSEKAVMWDGQMLFLDKWFDIITPTVEERSKEYKADSKKLTLPFSVNSKGVNKVIPPYLIFIDSWSESDITSADGKSEDGIDNSSNNPANIREGNVKTSIYNKISRMVLGGYYISSTASLDDKGADFATPIRKNTNKVMTHLPNNMKIKRTGTSYKKRSSSMWYFTQPVPCYKPKSKLPAYPLDQDDYFENNVDLECSSFHNARNKTGSSGNIYPLIRSQTEGVLPSIRELEFCRPRNNVKETYGISNGKQYCFYLDLYPDVQWRLTTVRKLFDEDPRARKAMEFTMALKMMFVKIRKREFNKYTCTPKELYEDIKNLGYDWDILYNTRSYWLFMEEEEGELPYLSILMLLKVRAGEKKIRWYKDVSGSDPIPAKSDV